MDKLVAQYSRPSHQNEFYSEQEQQDLTESLPPLSLKFALPRRQCELLQYQRSYPSTWGWLSRDWVACPGLSPTLKLVIIAMRRTELPAARVYPQSKKQVLLTI